VRKRVKFGNYFFDRATNSGSAVVKNVRQSYIISSLYVGMAIKYIIVLFVETPRKFITAKLSIRKPGSSSVLII
jgi:hypothetical protein